MDSQEIFIALRNTLADLYPREEYARKIISNTELIPDSIKFSPNARAAWNDILAETVRAEQLDVLLAAALSDYPQNTLLLTACSQYHQLIEGGGHVEIPGRLPDKNQESRNEEKHIDILEQGVDVWNQWRQIHPYIRPILFKASLEGRDLRGVNFHQANLVACNLSAADLEGADLTGANLSWAKFIGCKLVRADFRGANLYNTNFKDADLLYASLDHFELAQAIFDGAKLPSAIIEKLKANMIEGDFIGAGNFSVGSAPPSSEGKIAYGNGKIAKNVTVPIQIERFPDVSIRNSVPLGHYCTLRVALTQKPALKELLKKIIKLMVPAGADSVTVGVLVTAQDFEIREDDYRRLSVPADKDSEPLLFLLKPLSLGEKKIKVEFFQDSRYVGGITVTTTVVAPDNVYGSKPVNTRGVIALNEASSPPDLTILITESGSPEDKVRYGFKLHSPSNDLFFYNIHEELSFSGSPSKWIENLYRELGRLGLEARPEDMKETLSTIGADLYEKLFPDELKEIWENQIRNKVRSIMIISDEPWIPWEIIKPFHENETGDIVEDGFLCEDYSLTRWLAGPTPPSRIKIKRGALIAPATSNLPDVVHEAKFLKDMGLIAEIEPTLTMVRQLLSLGGYELIHFACHASFDPETHEQSSIYLQGNDKLLVRDIAGKRRNFRKDRPFVFINACSTARADFSLVGIGGWAARFIDANASGFLGSSWEVNDELASRFSESFYQALKDDKPIGQAMREARLKIQNDSDPTWLAYTLYADPSAKVAFV